MRCKKKQEKGPLACLGWMSCLVVRVLSNSPLLAIQAIDTTVVYNIPSADSLSIRFGRANEGARPRRGRAGQNDVRLDWSQSGPGGLYLVFASLFLLFYYLFLLPSLSSHLLLPTTTTTTPPSVIASIHIHSFIHSIILSFSVT